MSIFVVVVISTSIMAFMVGTLVGLGFILYQQKIHMAQLNKDLVLERRSIREKIEALNKLHNSQVESLQSVGDKVHDMELRFNAMKKHGGKGGLWQ